MSSTCIRVCAAMIVVLAGGAAAQAQEAKPADPAAKPKITYAEHIQPIFREHCFTCHSQDQKKSDLALDSYAATMAGGAGGEDVIAGDVASSRLYGMVAHTESPKMPPEQDRLSDAKLALIKQWILDGALENSGSKAKPANRPNLALKGPGNKKPDGPPPMPEGLFREPFVYTSRPGAVTALATSPWAPLLAVGGQKQVLLYSSDTYELLGVLPFPEGTPHVLKFSRSGTLLLAAGGRGGHSGRVVLFDVKSGNRVAEIGDELDIVLAADINDDHTLVALGGPRRIVRIYSVEDGTVQAEMRKHTDWVYSLEFSPDGVLLATADRSGGLFVWEADTGREFQNLTGHTAGITDVSWRADSNILASCSEDGSIKLWEMENGKQVKSWGAHNGGVLSVEFAADGQLVSGGRDKIAKIWDNNGNAKRSLPAMNDMVMETIFTHDGKAVVAGDWTGEIRVNRTDDGALLANLLENPPTLEMLVKLEADKAVTAEAAATKLSGELNAARQAADATAAQTKAAAEKAAASAALLKKLEADKPQLAKTAEQKTAAVKPARDAAAAARAAVDKARQEQATAAQAAQQRAGAAKAAAQQAAAAEQVLAKAREELAKAEKESADAAAPKTAVTAAEKKAMDTKVAAEKAKAEQAAADKLAADKATALKTAQDKAAAAQQAADQAEADRVAAVKAVTDHANALKAAAAAAPADKAAADKLAAEKTAAEKLLAEKTAALKAAQDEAAAAKARSARAAAEKAALEKVRTAQASAAK